jgi:LmbE family N-acetylglucosaminyl deacetylase
MAEQPLGWGVLAPETFDRVVVVSPHFDDAALGTAQLILAVDNVTVVTTFAGAPAAYPDPVSEWDALGGFQLGDDIVTLRREEDRAAMKVLGADYRWLGYVDHQYVTAADRATALDVATDLERVLEELDPTVVCFPLGLANPDHAITHEAGVMLASRLRELTWLAYENSGYKHIPGMLAWRISKLFQGELWPTPVLVPVADDRAGARAAIECYTSQLPPLNRDHALQARLANPAAEQYWRLDPPPAGWERMRDL